MRPQEYKLEKADTAQTYLDIALASASKRASARKAGRSFDRVNFAKDTELGRFATIRDTLTHSLERVHDSYPNFDQMSEFLLRLFELDMEAGKVKQALGAIHASNTMIKVLTREHMEIVKRAETVVEVARTRSVYIGRVSSMMRQIGKHLLVLNQAREIIRNLPSVDDELFTVAIAGFPNVGKSTLLSKLTTAKPEIKPYAFTTKGLNVGYFEYRYNQIQCIDTPGTLNRAKPNPIERKADAAIKYLAHVLVYVFDPTEGGYSMEEQLELYKRTVVTGKTLFVYISKTDIVEKKAVERLHATLDATGKIEYFSSPDALKKAIIKAFREEFV